MGSEMSTEHSTGLGVSVVAVIAAAWFELGVPAFILLCIYWMLRNTSKDGKKEGLSAYSVFNKNQESIHGTTSAKQFEDELYRKMY